MTLLFSVIAGPLSVLVAAGPFSLSGDLQYQPLQSLLELCNDKRPDILLLLGPFVDAEHGKIQNGLIDQAFQDIFEEKVSDPSGNQI